MSYEQQIRGALARGYCTPENSSKELDSTLLEAMTQEILKSVGFTPSDDSRQLGYSEGAVQPGAVAEVLNRLKVVAEKQRLYHLNIRNKNKRQETSIERVEYSDSKSSQSAYEYMLDEINKELTKIANASL